MSYATVNFKSKKALKDAVSIGGAPVRLQPPLIGEPVLNGRAFLEGPWYPKPHTWYAQVWLVDGVVVRVVR